VLSVAIHRLPLARSFAISRGARDVQPVVRCRIVRDGVEGHGECAPYARYGETPKGVAAQIEGLAGWLDGALREGPASARAALLDAAPPCAARNALDCALWDLEAKAAGRRAWELAGTAAPGKTRSVLTVALDAPRTMARAAAALSAGAAIKVKLGAGDGRDPERVAAVRAARPDAWLMTDSNEGTPEADLPALLDACRAAGVALIEQPLPEGAEPLLERLRAEGRLEGLTLCADESCRKDADMAALARAYGAVNLKLDKTGGLTRALADANAARDAGLGVMVGCMLGSSLAMAPGAVLAAAAGADPVDLDGPTWLAEDAEPGCVATDGRVTEPQVALWG
jgi:L-alanine-DL-glutamate epimerase-like enolase superfamily enzyme